MVLLLVSSALILAMVAFIDVLQYRSLAMVAASIGRVFVLVLSFVLESLVGVVLVLFIERGTLLS